MNVIAHRALTLAGHRRARKVALWTAVIVAGFGLLLAFAVPPLLRGQLAAQLSEKLHRSVSLEQIKINPFAMTVALRGFAMKERQSPTNAASFDELFVNLDIRSLFRVAPVIEELRLTKPYVNLVRHEDGKYNFQDLIDEFTSGPPGPTPRFALNNIEIIDGTIDFDDRPERIQHRVTGLKLGVPFFSSLPAHVDIKVRPELAAVINGAPFHLIGDATSPFKDMLESTLEFDLDRVEIGKYFEYSPVPLNFKISSGQLNGKIRAAFKTAKNDPAVLALSGNLALTALDMQNPSGAPLLKLPSLEVVVDSVDVFGNRASVKSVKAQGIDLHIQRDRNGAVNLANLVAAPSDAKAVEAKKDPGKPFAYRIEELTVAGATIRLLDEQPQLPYRVALDHFTLSVAGLDNEADRKAQVELSFETESKEKFSHSGTLQLTPLIAEGKVNLEALRLSALSPYYRQALAAEVKDGRLDLAALYSFDNKTDQPDIKLSELSATLRGFRLELAGQPEPLWRVGAVAVKDGRIDLAKKSVSIGALEAKDGAGYIQRDSAGDLNLARIVKNAAATAPSPPPAAQDGGPWNIEAKQIVFDRFSISFDDRAAPTPVKSSLSELSLRAENFSNQKNRPAKVTLRARINNRGALRAAGPVTADPPTARLAVEGEDIEVLPFQPYLENQVNFLLTGGRIGTKGNLSVDTGGSGPAKVSYDGSIEVADFATVERTSSQDLLRWKSLLLNAFQFNLEPFQLRIGEIHLADFYSRLILGADGKTNLQKLTTQAEEPESAAPPPEKTFKSADKPAPAPPPPGGSDKAISIGKINLQGGNVHFSDFFIKPNYSANLTGVQGAIAELKPESPGDLDIQARLDNSAPVDIKGKINPLSKELFLDLAADAKEIELNPMTPYAAKYVGYGIEKGKLSFNVKYKLENRKLMAENRIILNQLTFGEKIDSPDATKLPVLLAVALLKDRNGVIDVELPISGSLDDPQFSVGGIILRIIINIITKAITAPFSLLAAAFGGASGEELSYIEFDSGRASLNQAAQAKIATLAKALSNRPGLSLELSGRVDPSSDFDGLRRLSLERKVKAQKLKAMVRRGESAKSVDDVRVEPNEYPQYLKAAYGEESFPKPRNFIGMAQDLPVPEMEKLMLQHARVGDDDLRELASQRAQAVRDALLGAGQIGAERLFIVAAKPLTPDEGAKLKGRPNRVDFTMK